MTGHNSMKMTDLSELYKDLGYNDAETYIQSGNVIFTSHTDQSTAQISQSIERAILKKFSYEIPVIIRSVNELTEIISENPFLKEENFDPAKMAVIFLTTEPSEIALQKVAGINYPPDKFIILGREIYIYCPNGFGRTKLYTNFFEKKMGVTGTARNWKTINTMFTLAGKK